MNTITIDISELLMHYIIPYILMCIGWYYIISTDYERMYYRFIYICWACILALFSTAVYVSVYALLSQIHFNITL
jgi:hypothetical protein